MKKIISILILTLIIGSNFDKVLIGSMYIVDAFGNITNTPVIDQIDFLNEVYYNLYE